MQQNFISEYLNKKSIDFIKYQNSKKPKIEILARGNQIEIIFKGNIIKENLIKDYFRTTNENNENYKGKILNGELHLTTFQFENYVSKKIINKS